MLLPICRPVTALADALLRVAPVGTVQRAPGRMQLHADASRPPRLSPPSSLPARPDTALPAAQPHRGHGLASHLARQASRIGLRLAGEHGSGTATPPAACLPGTASSISHALQVHPHLAGMAAAGERMLHGRRLVAQAREHGVQQLGLPLQALSAALDSDLHASGLLTLAPGPAPPTPTQRQSARLYRAAGHAHGMVAAALAAVVQAKAPRTRAAMLFNLLVLRHHPGAKDSP